MPTRLSLAVAVVMAITVAPSAQQPDTNEHFYQAIRTNDLAALRSLIGEANQHPSDNLGHTPLMIAAAFGTAESVELLLEKGANARATSASGATALHLAVRDARKVRLLLGAGADVDAKSRLGRTPLLVAASTNGSLEVVRLLLEKGVTLDAADTTGLTPLIAAAAVDDTEVAKLLLEKGADPNAGGERPARHALSAAASNGNVALTRLLLARGAKINAATSPLAGGTVKNGPIQSGSVTALHAAVVGGNQEVVKILLDAGATVDPLDVRGMTPLMFAVATDRPSSTIVSVLLDKGADRSLRSKANESSLDWAHKFNNPEVLSELKLQPARSAVSPRPSASHRAATPREAVERSMPLLRIASARMMTDGGCVACHAQPMWAIAADSAASRGWRVEGAGTDAAQAALDLTAGVPNRLQAREGGGAPDTQLFITWMLASTRRPPSLSTDAMVHYLAAKQRREGNWHVVGSTRAPIQDGDFLRTTMAIQALKVYGAPALKTEMTERIARAAAWLATEPPISTQDRTMQLLGLKWADANARLREARMNELLAIQRPDGGWAQTPHLESDAYGTGQVLYALAELGVPATDPAVQRGVAFLTRTQRYDGSWYVRNRAMKIQPYFESGFPYEHDQWISQAGTSWAVIGLARLGHETPVATSASQ